MSTKRIAGILRVLIFATLFTAQAAYAEVVTQSLQPGNYSITISVPGMSDPWLAGMPPGSTASCTDVAPAQSPVEVLGLPLPPGGTALIFSANGLVANGTCGPPLCPASGPDGDFPLLFHDSGAENGISNAGAPINSLIGVFLGPDQPDLTPPPNTLDFTSGPAQNYLVLTPELKQVFFIGDGHTNDARVQKVMVSAKATRLFLGTMDGCSWGDNLGSFTVTIHVVPTNKDQCQNEGWKAFGFKNQGQCIQYVNTGK